MGPAYALTGVAFAGGIAAETAGGAALAGRVFGPALLAEAEAGLGLDFRLSLRCGPCLDAAVLGVSIELYEW